MSGLLTTAEVAHRLGVKPETVYAYVSRGLLERHEQSGRRRSLFSADAVDRLAGRARRPGRSDAFEVVIETELTALDPAGRLFYRGRDVTELARFRSFEDVAGLLWGGDPLAPWELDDDDRPADRGAAARRCPRGSPAWMRSRSPSQRSPRTTAAAPTGVLRPSGALERGSSRRAGDPRRRRRAGLLR